MLNMISEKARSIIRNEVVLKGINPSINRYFNRFVFCPENNNRLRDFHYYQPSFCVSRKTGREIDIRQNREGKYGKTLMGQNSDQTSLFWARTYGKGINCLRELVILYSDSDLQVFRSFLIEEGLTKKDVDVDIWNRNYVSADFYFPEYGMIVELDSEYHKQPGVDRARDRTLLKQYGLRTYRIYRYDRSPWKHEAKIQVILASERLEFPLYFNQVDLIVDRFIESNSDFVRDLEYEIGRGNKNPLKSLYMSKNGRRYLDLTKIKKKSRGA